MECVDVGDRQRNVDLLVASLLKKDSETCSCYSSNYPKVRPYKNVIGAGLSLMLVFTTYFGFMILQISIIYNQQLIFVTLLIQNFTFLISGLFTSSIIQLLGTKYTLILSCCLSMVFGIANYYPQWYTLIPGSVCFGIAQGPIMASVNVHVTTIAIKYAPELNEKTDHLIALFTGMMTMFYRMGLLLGNLATTIILFSERHSSDSDIIDTALGNICNNTEVDTLNTTYVYILMSVYALMTIGAIVVAMFFMDHFGIEVKFQSYAKFFKSHVKDPCIKTIKMFTEWKFLLIQIPMVFVSPFAASLTFGQFSKYYVSDCIGVHWIGLFAITYGVSSALSGFVSGRLVKWIPQFIIVYSFSALMMAHALFFLFWDREPSYVTVFVPTAIIGSCEGVWNSVPPTLIGILFPHKKEPAFSALRMGLSLGASLAFMVALFSDIRISLWFEVILVVISVVTYSLLVFTTQSKDRIFPLCGSNMSCMCSCCCSKRNPYMYTIAVTQDH